MAKALIAASATRPLWRSNSPRIGIEEHRAPETGKRRLPGLTSSICTSPITRSMKPPSQ